MARVLKFNLAQGDKTFFMLNSAEHEIYPVHKFLNAYICWHFNIYEHDKNDILEQETSSFINILVFMRGGNFVLSCV